MSDPVLERLHPDGARLTAVELAAQARAELPELPDRPYVLCNMVTTVDGHVTIGGRSGPIGGDADHSLFHALRETCDALLVGAGTLRVERYGRVIRKPERHERRAAAGLAEDPLAVVISRGLELPWDAPIFAAPGQRIVLFTRPEAPDPPAGLSAQVEVVRMEALGPEGALQALHADYGVRSVLCEGGPHLNRSLLQAGALDELWLALGPLLAGGDPAPGIVSGPPLPEPLPARPLWIMRHEDEVFLRYRLR